ncbi:polysaccharide deacetylase family protein [Maritalea porphyrae]|uniref:polysaccharide deacetylase family protein n=1 Tax=Maritalea porphyrae TaxID=880732 RepID=UPI0022AE609A|nr:polysaccharide deacetylase family protein [Maritalea porphyrae]MCZ4273538.1 polysaccharide deacetylase family protein [Maritalea porphyrae]
MLCVRVVLASVCLCAWLTGCAKPPQRLDQSATPTSQQLAYAAQNKVTSPLAVQTANPEIDTKIRTASINNDAGLNFSLRRGLTGRDLTIETQADVKLAAGEVVITFDDGPRPGKTDTILDILDQYNAKATFLMLGQAAQKHPGLVREVAKRGHTVGLHTHTHGDLTKVNLVAALAEIERGRQPLVAALSPINKAPAPFFRFPYLAQNQKLRRAVNNAGLVIMDVQIDSKDYYKASSAEVLQRTLARLDQQGKGIVLFHDIHQRTVDMLPDFLAELKSRGYKVVALVPDQRLQLRSNTLLAQNN